MAVPGTQVRDASGAGPLEPVTVRGIASGGDGVGALPDGCVVFLPRTAPGDRVLVRTEKRKGRWAKGEVVQFLEEGPGRSLPPCPHFSDCDGCTLQHLDYEEQLRWKGRLVGDALRRIGGLDQVDPPIEPSPHELGYRNKITFTLRRLSGGQLVAGFRDRRRQGRILDVAADCLLPEEGLIEAWRQLRAEWGPGASLLPEGREIRLTLRSGTHGVALLVRGGRGDGQPDLLMERVPGLTSIWREEQGPSVRLLGGVPAIQVEWMGDALEIPGAGFLQVNTMGGEGLHGFVLEEAGAVAGLRVIDAFCGVGTLGRALAERGATVVGIESDPAGIAVGKARAPEGQQLVEGLVEEELGKFLPADLILLNPPRSGLAASIPELLKDHAVERVIYVSCDPATLARDLQRLGPGFQVLRVRSFDLFPQTAHVETVISLTKKSGWLE